MISMIILSLMHFLEYVLLIVLFLLFLLLLLLHFNLIVLTLFNDGSFASPLDLSPSALANQSSVGKTRVSGESAVYSTRHVHMDHILSRKAMMTFYPPPNINPNQHPANSSGTNVNHIVKSLDDRIESVSDIFWSTRTSHNDDHAEEDEFVGWKLSQDLANQIDWKKRNEILIRMAKLSMAIDALATRDKGSNNRKEMKFAFLVGNSALLSASNRKQLGTEPISFVCALLTWAIYNSEHGVVVHLPTISGKTLIGCESVLEFKRNPLHEIWIDTVFVDKEHGVPFLERIISLAETQNTPLCIRNVIIIDNDNESDELKIKTATRMHVQTLSQFEADGSVLSSNALDKPGTFTLPVISDYFRKRKSAPSRIISIYYNQSNDSEGKRVREICHVQAGQMLMAVTALNFHFPKRINLSKSQSFLIRTPNYGSPLEHIASLWAIYRGSRVCFLRYSAYHPSFLPGMRGFGVNSHLSDLLDEIALLEPSVMCMPAVALIQLRHFLECNKRPPLFFKLPALVKSILHGLIQSRIDFGKVRSSVFFGKGFVGGFLSTLISSVALLGRPFGSSLSFILCYDGDQLTPDVLRFYLLNFGCQIINCHGWRGVFGLSNMTLPGDYLSVASKVLEFDPSSLARSTAMPVEEDALDCIPSFGLVGPPSLNNWIKLKDEEISLNQDDNSESISLYLKADDCLGQVYLKSSTLLGGSQGEHLAGDLSLDSKGWLSTKELAQITTWGSFQSLGTWPRDFCTLKLSESNDLILYPNKTGTFLCATIIPYWPALSNPSVCRESYHLVDIPPVASANQGGIALKRDLLGQVETLESSLVNGKNTKISVYLSQLALSAFKQVLLRQIEVVELSSTSNSTSLLALYHKIGFTDDTIPISPTSNDASSSSFDLDKDMDFLLPRQIYWEIDSITTFYEHSWTGGSNDRQSVLYRSLHEERYKSWLNL